MSAALATSSTGCVSSLGFFQISQFKRTCVPNAPKVGSGGSLSPRGDYRAPSDAEATAWLEQVKRIPDHE
jgi:NAD+ synthase (glutamine-hydrolysing)